MEETKEQQAAKLQQLRTTLQNFNRRYNADGFRVCHPADTQEAAGTIIAANLEAIIRQRGRSIRQPDREAFRAVAGWLKGDGHPWLLMSGTPGTGKTTYLTAIERAARWAHASDQIAADIRTVKASSLGYTLKTSPAEWEAVKSCKLLLVDDIGFSGEAEVVNNYGVNARPVVELLESRYDSRRHTVMTTNLTLPQIRQTYGERIYSRLAELCTVVAMTGQDFRLCAG